MSESSEAAIAQSTIPKRRRRRRLLILIGVILALVAIVVAAEGIVRSYAAKEIAAQVRVAASIPAATAIDVTVGGASVLLQLASGRLSDVTIRVDDLTFGALSGNAEITALGVPLDQSKTIDSATLGFTLNQNQLTQVLSGYATQAGVTISSVAVTDGAVRVSTQFSILGMTLPVAVALTPSVIDGQIALTPKTIMIGGRTLTADEVRTNFGSVANAVLQPQTVCVRTFLPQALTLDTVDVVGSSVRLEVGGKSLHLNESMLNKKGVCP